jgi:hypothetical protein
LVVSAFALCKAAYMISLTRRSQSPSIPLQVPVGTVSDGSVDGAANGSGDGAVDGLAKGDGDVDGSVVDEDIDGSVDGDIDDAVDGSTDGLSDGNVDGAFDGVIDGEVDDDGIGDGTVDGRNEGGIDGMKEGNVDGNVDGVVVTDGRNDGFAEGCAEPVIAVDGWRVGIFVSVDGNTFGKEDGEKDPSPVAVEGSSAAVISLLTLPRSSDPVTVRPTLTATTMMMTRVPSKPIHTYRYLGDSLFCGSTEVASLLRFILVVAISSFE